MALAADRLKVLIVVAKVVIVGASFLVIFLYFFIILKPNVDDFWQLNHTVQCREIRKKTQFLGFFVLFLGTLPSLGVH